MDNMCGRFLEQVDVLLTQIGHVYTLRFWPEQAEAMQGLYGALDILLDGLMHFALGFVQMDVHGHIEFCSERGDLAQVLFIHGVGCMRTKDNGHELAVF